MEDKREIEVGVDRSDSRRLRGACAKGGWRCSTKSWPIGDLEVSGLLAGKATLQSLRWHATERPFRQRRRSVESVHEAGNIIRQEEAR